MEKTHEMLTKEREDLKDKQERQLELKADILTNEKFIEGKGEQR